MDKTDAQLINYVFEFHMEVSDMFRENFELLTNETYHHLQKSELFDRLSVLCKQGIIEFRYQRNTLVVPDNGMDLNHLRYNLTEYGGNLWEELFKPDWSLFADYYETPVSDDRAIVVCRSMRRAEVERVCDQPEKIIAINRWNPLYWKSLDSGYLYYDLIAWENPEPVFDRKWRISWDEIQI